MKSIRFPKCLSVLWIGIILCYLSYSYASYAQQAKIDSLERVLSKKSLPDSTRIKTLITLSKEFMWTQPEKAREAGEQALAVAERINDKKQIASTQQQIGRSLANLKIWDKAIEYFERSKKICEEIDDKYNLALLFQDIGMVYQNKKDFAKALEYYEYCLNTQKQLGDKAEIANAVMRIGMVHNNMQEYSKAIECFEQCVALREGLNDRSALASVLWHVGVLYDHTGSAVKALEAFQRSLKLVEELGNKGAIANTLNSLGVVSRNAGDYDKALEYYERSLTIYEAMADKKGIALTLNNIGDIHMYRGANEKAFEYYQRGLKIREEIGDKYNIARSLNSMSHYYQNISAYDKALECLQRALKIFEELGDKGSTSMSLHNIGMIYHKTDSYDKALEYHQKSLKIREESGDKNSIAHSLDNIGTVYNSLGLHEKSLDYTLRGLKILEEIGGDGIPLAYFNVGATFTALGNYQKALEYMNRSYSMLEKQGDKRNVAMALAGIGDVYIELAEYDKAMDYYQRSLKIEQEIGNKSGIASAYAQIGNAYSKIGNHDKALEYIRQSLKLREELGEKDIVIGLINEAFALSKKKVYDGAEMYYLRALELAKKTGSIYNLEHINKALYEFYEIRGDSVHAFSHFKDYTAFKDSLLNEQNVKNINEMTTKYETEQNIQKIVVLEKDKALKELTLKQQKDKLTLQELELAHRQEQLTIQNLTAIRLRQQSALLAHENEIRELELDKKTSELDLNKTELALNKSENEKKKNEVALQASVIEKEKLLRNSFIIGLVLFICVAGLVYKNLQDKKHKEALRAESAEHKAQVAEYKAQAAEAQSLAVLIEAEKHEKELQQKFSWELLESQEQERKRIAGELHDGVGQEVMVMKNQLYLVLKNEDIHPHAKERLEQVTSTATSLLEEVRRLSRNLRPAQLDELGLTEALQTLLYKIKDTAPFTLTHNIESVDGLIDREKEINVYRIVQEGMNNILKHSEAKNAKVLLTRSNGSIVLQIQDDGKGFDTKEHSVKRGFGLKNISERVAILGGEMKLHSRHGNGTRIDIVLPVHVLAT